MKLCCSFPNACPFPSHTTTNGGGLEPQNIPKTRLGVWYRYREREKQRELSRITHNHTAHIADASRRSMRLRARVLPRATWRLLHPCTTHTHTRPLGLSRLLLLLLLCGICCEGYVIFNLQISIPAQSHTQGRPRARTGGTTHTRQKGPCPWSLLLGAAAWGQSSR